MSQKVEKVQKGGEGSAPEIKKSTIQNVDFLTRGGEAIFSFFSQIQMHTLDFFYFPILKLPFPFDNGGIPITREKFSSITFLDKKVQINI